MKNIARFITVFVLIGRLLLLPVQAQPTPAPSNVALTVNKTTGVIVGPIDANLFKSANSIAGGGTVTSVALSAPALFSVGGSPVTTSGTLALTYSGTALPVANGGTGLTSPGTSGNVLTSNGTAWVSSPASGGGSGNVTVSGTPTSGQIAEWTSATNIQGKAVIGSGNVVLDTSPSFTTNLTLATGTAPTTGAAGALAFDTNAWASGRGAGQLYDGTANTNIVATLASDTPSNGQVPTWNTGGTITWETVSGTGNVTGGALTANAVVIGGGSNAITVLASLGSAGQPLVSAGAGAPPAFGQLTLSNTTTFGGILPASLGGTGVSSITSQGVVIGNGTGAITTVAPGTSGNVLTSNGTAWTSAASASGSGNVTNSGTLTSGNIIMGAGTTVVTVTGATYGAANGGTITLGNIVLTGNGVFTTNTINVTDLNVTNPIGMPAGGTGFSTTTKGNIIVGNNTTTYGQLGVGTNGQVLIANSSATLGVEWGAAGAGNVTGGSLTSGSLVIGGGANAITVTTTGTGVVTALGVNTGSSGAFVVNGGALGTPSSGTLTSATGLPISTGVSGLGTGIATALAVNVGSAGAPILFNGAAGTPSSITLTNGSGLPIAGLTNSTSAGLGVGSIYLGHASDTQIYRAAAGTVAINSEIIATDINTLTLTKKQQLSSGALGTDDTWEGDGITGLTAGATIAQWEAVYVGGSSTYLLADANGSGTYPARGLAVAAYSSTNAAVIVTKGTVRNDAWAWTPGGTIYISTTAGGLTQTAPSTSGDKVQQVGYALTADIAYFDFNSEYLTVD